MTTSIGSVPPLRVRYGDSKDDIVDIAWSDDPADTNPPSIAFLHSDALPGGKTSWDVEDPTDPDNETYPPYDAASLQAVELVRCAASHWQRVHPRMRRFTQTELEGALLLVALNSTATYHALDRLVEARHGACQYVAERYPEP